VIVPAKPVSVTKTQLGEDSIGRELALNFFTKKYVVMVPNCNWTGHECDILAVSPSLKIVDIEIKISRSDLKADAGKSKWWRHEHAGYGEVVETRNHHGTVVGSYRPTKWNKILKPWPQKVWKHYYCMPEDIWSDDLLETLASPNSGVLLMWYRGRGLEIKCKRRAKPNNEAKAISPENVMDIARLATLRMWEAKLRLEASWHEKQHLRAKIAELETRNEATKPAV